MEKATFEATQALVGSRKEMPWTKVDKDYRFVGPEGEVGLAEMFGDRGQLIVYHFMFAPEWEKPCSGCSYMADHLERCGIHVRQRDTRLILVSRASQDQINGAKKVMNWTTPWYTAIGTEFVTDCGVYFPPELKDGDIEYNFELGEYFMEDLPGLSVFVKGDDGEVYQTYSAYSWALVPLNTSHILLDMTPGGCSVPGEHDMEWVRRWPEYPA